MRFEQIKNRVQRGEALVEGRMTQVRDHAAELRLHWQQGLTPPRILIAGLIAGFVVGHANPARSLRRVAKLGNPRWIQMITSLSSLAASLQSAFAAATAKDADDASNPGGGDGDGVRARPSTAARKAAAAAAASPPAPAVESPGNTFPPPGPAADRRRRSDPVWTSAPSPAEAATDVSEQR